MSTPGTTPRPALGVRALVASAVGIAAVAGVAGGLIVHLADDDTGPAAVAAASETRCPATTIADNVLPSVVTLSVRNGSSSGSGSGETIRDNGYILTNDHVISLAAGGGTIDVLFSSGQTERATLAGRPPAWTWP